MKREDKEFYKGLRKGGVPFVDAHKLARLAYRDGVGSSLFHAAEKMAWAKRGPSEDYGRDNLEDPQDENHFDWSIKLPRKGFLIYDNRYGTYVAV
jgi:hypothetical protein